MRVVLELGWPIVCLGNDGAYHRDDVSPWAGEAQLGYFTAACVRLDKQGPSMMPHGNSYIQVVSFNSKGVEPYTLLLASQSSDPGSPYYRDYTRAYSRKEWLRAPFTEQEIAASTAQSLELTEPSRSEVNAR
jgi:acyl-homoserine-lactone acylase